MHKWRVWRVCVDTCPHQLRAHNTPKFQKLVAPPAKPLMEARRVSEGGIGGGFAQRRRNAEGILLRVAVDLG